VRPFAPAFTVSRRPVPTRRYRRRRVRHAKARAGMRASLPIVVRKRCRYWRTRI